MVGQNDIPMVDDDDLMRTLQYDCNYAFHVAKVGGKENVKTWGEIVNEDYLHFVELMCFHVGKDTQTFQTLSSQLQPPDLERALESTRIRDTEEFKDMEIQRFLNYTCTHNSKYNGRTWGFILGKNYQYYLWSVANTMGRDTRTFKALVQKLKPADRASVLGTPKGKFEVKWPKGKTPEKGKIVNKVR